jgi:hypothetical protein
LNHNGIPDECEPQMTWYVDASAPSGGNGSAGSPFTALGQAFSAAISNDVVLVANGLYVGPANRELDFGNRDLTVQSLGGSANCTIDCQGLGRAFVVKTAVTAASRIEGFTIKNGKSTGTGGGMLVKGSNPWIVACAFLDCNAQSGGALSLENSSASVVDCTFDGGSASANGGNVLIASSANAILLHCTIARGRAGNGGGVGVYSSGAYFEGCEFLGNTAVQSGGAAYGESTTWFLDQCLLAGNVGKNGGALSTYRGISYITSCTVAQNNATTAGGAWYFQNSFTPVFIQSLRNSVFWNNTAGNGWAFDVRSAMLDIAYCDLQGGQASILVGTNGSVTWGAGNMNADPLFADPDGPDNNPLTLADNDYRLSLGSPCIDSGDNSSAAVDVFDLDGDGNGSEPVPFDFDGNPRFVDIASAPNVGAGPPPIIDMGPWERQP